VSVPLVGQHIPFDEALTLEQWRRWQANVDHPVTWRPQRSDSGLRVSVPSSTPAKNMRRSDFGQPKQTTTTTMKGKR
jgi:hypothetical protein